MGRPWHDSRRRVTMQCVMWLVLAAAVAGAALLNRQVRLQRYVRLDPPRDFGEIRVPLPHGWTRLSDKSGSGMLVRMAAPGGDQSRRQLLILHRRTRSFLPPRVFMSRQDNEDDDDPSAEASLIEPITIGGYPGTLIRRHIQLPGDGAARLDAEVVRACVVFPWRRAIEIYQVGPGISDTGGVDLVRRVAAGIQLIGRPKLSDSKVLKLEGISLPVPTGWRIAPEDDPNRLAGQLLFADRGQWASAEVIPCHVPDDAPDGLRSLAAINSPRWMNADVAELPAKNGLRQWRLDLPPSRGYLRRIYIAADADHRGVIVIFRGYGVDPSRLDRAWEGMIDGSRLDSTDDWTEMVHEGERSARQWSEATLERLLPTREDQWWLWYGTGTDAYVGWLNLQWLSPTANAAVPWRAVWEARLLDGDGQVTRRSQTIGGNGDLRTYADLAQEWRTTDDGQAFAATGRESTGLRDGRLTLSDTDATAATRPAGRPAPANFVGGGWLPLLIGHCGDHAMILKSESFLFQSGGSNLFDIVARPISPPSTESAAVASTRVFLVHVNGSGDLTRWIISSDGAVQSIQAARGMQLLAVGPQDLRVDFQDDARMQP